MKLTHPSIPAIVSWRRQSREGSRAYQAFCIYRDIGPKRSLAKAYRLRLGNSEAAQNSAGGGAVCGTWTMWCSRHGWVARAQAWDAYWEGVDLKARAGELARKGIDWATETRDNLQDRLDTLRHLRRSVLERVENDDFVDKRIRRKFRDTDGSWNTEERRIRLELELRALEGLTRELFPPDDVPSVTDR